MPNIDFTSAYRDATKGSTLKALAARRAEMQAAMAMAKPREVKSPEQAIASVAETISGSIREGRLANQEAAGRARFAQLLAGGLTPDEAGEAYGLDAETTQKWMDRNWAQEDNKTAAAARENELLRSHGWDVDKQTAEVQARKDAAAALEQANITLADHNATIEEKQAAQKVLDEAGVAETTAETDIKKARVQEDLDRESAALQSELDIKKENATRETFTQVTPQMVTERGLGGDIAAHPDQFQINDKTGQITPYQKAAGAPALKEQYDAQDKLASIDSHLDDLNRALELNDKVIQGPVGGFAAEVMGSDPTGILQAGAEWAGQKDRIEATKEFGQLMSAGAMTRMAEELKGSTAYQEVMHYQNIFASPTATTEVRKNALMSMLNVLQKHRAVSAARIESYGAEKPGDYTYTSRTAAPAGAGTEPAADTAAPDLSTMSEEELRRRAAAGD
jgi:hypothetical protein